MSMNRYNAQILNDKGEYHLQFETDNRKNFNAMEKLAQKIMDKKPPTNFDKIMQNVDSFIKWVLDNYNSVPPGLNCETSCNKDCGECFKKWLLQDAE